jgi:predicted secreted protein
VKKRWQSKAKKTGTIKVILHLYRVWEEKEKAVSTFEVEINIKDGSERRTS